MLRFFARTLATHLRAGRSLFLLTVVGVGIIVLRRPWVATPEAERV